MSEAKLTLEYLRGVDVWTVYAVNGTVTFPDSDEIAEIWSKHFPDNKMQIQSGSVGKGSEQLCFQCEDNLFEEGRQAFLQELTECSQLENLVFITADIVAKLHKSPLYLVCLGDKRIFCTLDEAKELCGPEGGMIDNTGLVLLSDLSVREIEPEEKNLIYGGCIIVTAA